jgi:penicillin-binding protein 1A
MKGKTLALIAAGTIGVGIAAGGALVATQDCPPVDALISYEPPQATRVFALDGSRIADLSPQRRVVVELREVPAALANGFVAVEDRRFWQHHGVDPRGALRALWRGVTFQRQEGFSTITMQLTRNIFPEALPMSERFGRKICEVRIAAQVERSLEKREILKMYLNQVYMGDGLYGVEEASRGYFGKAAGGMDIAETALIIGLVKNPEGYNPRRQPLRAIARRNVVLGVMEREGVISPAEAARAKAQPVRLAAPLEASGPAPYFVAAVRQELRRMYGSTADVQGLRVFTGLDPAVQRAARESLVAQIRRVEAGEHGTWRHPVPGADRLEPADGSGSPYLQGMVVVLDARNGEVRALVGGRDFTHSSYDRALSARRQPGSSFKPIVFAAALQRGLTVGSMVETTPITVGNSGSAAWRPDDLVHDTIASLSARQALALSSNHAAVRVGEFAGVNNVVALGRALGLTTPIPPYPSIYLGAAEVVPVEFAAAYATLGNGGRYVAPRLITRVENARGQVLWSAPADARQVVDPGVAFLTVNMMQDVVDSGTATSIRRAGFWLPAAGKTGTTNDAKDVWFVGMTPDLVGAVWLGFDQPKRISGNASGGRLAAPIWAETMKAAYATRPAPAPWQPPGNVMTMAVDRQSGMAATANCPPENIMIEYFLSGTEPGHYCPLHPDHAADSGLRGLWRRITGGG